MARWLVSVAGEPFDLEELPRWFPSGDVHAIAEGQSVFLTGSAFDVLNEPTEILDAAAEDLNERCAILALLWPAFRPASVGVVICKDDEGRRVPSHILRAELPALRMKDGRPSVFPPQTDPPGGLTDAQRLLDASRSDCHLSTALMLWAEGREIQRAGETDVSR